MLSGISGVVCGILFVITEKYDVYDIIFVIKAALAIFGLLAGIKFIKTYFKLRTSGSIVVTDTGVELPQYLLKPKQINFSDIIFVSEREVEDGIIKISSRHGFDEIKRKFMIPEEFNELVVIFRAACKN